MKTASNPYLFIVDLETTGFSPRKNDVLEIAAIVAKKTGDEYEIVSTFNESSRPYSKSSWTFSAENVHGISFAEAMTYQVPRKMLIKLMYFLVPFRVENDKPLLFVCHAKNKFDFKFLEEAFFKEQLQDSFRKIFNRDHYESTHDIANNYKSAFGVPNLKLNTLAEYFDIKLDHHKAFSDATACYLIYKRLKKMGYQLDMNV